MGKIDAQPIDTQIERDPHRPLMVFHASTGQDGNLVEFRNAQGEKVLTIDPAGAVHNLTNPALRSMPPPGHFRVTNLYVDSGTGKLVVEYDDGS